MVHAITVLAISFFAAPLASHLLMPAMAALLIHVAWNMSDPGNWLTFSQGRKTRREILAMDHLWFNGARGSHSRDWCWCRFGFVASAQGGWTVEF